MRNPEKKPGRSASGRGFGRLRRLRRNEDGTTAVEFAMVAVPFLALLFGIFEIALVFFGTFTLENAVERAAREIRTGQAQAAGMSLNQFKTKVCARVSALPNCMSKLVLDARSWPTFSAVSADPPSNPIKGNGDLNAANVSGWDIGGSGSVVLVRAFYKWDVIGRIPGVGLSNQTDGSRLISAIATFRNEPWQ